MTKPPPSGQRFSHVYLKRGEPTQDSARMRRRIASLIGAIKDLQDDSDFDRDVEAKLGIPATWSSSSSWTTLLPKWQLVDVLDLITIAHHFLVRKRQRGMRDPGAPGQWIGEVNNIFTEENVHYTVDERGGVHFKFDDEFARNAAATIAALRDPRYANALDSYEKSMVALSQAQPDGKTAIRANFAAVEGLFRLMFPSSPRLTSAEAQHLVSILQKMLVADATALGASTKILNAFKDWIDAAHFYRHEPGVEEPAQPPIQTTVALVSLGSAYLRWLAELDAWRQVMGN
jgi:hypothetical protein